MNKFSVRLIVAFALSFVFLTACTPGGPSNDIRGQLTGNQGVLLALQNSNELDHLYLIYQGDQAPVGDNPRNLPTGGLRTNEAQGSMIVGELNLLMHNVGQSAAAGGIFISGYDPNLITICGRGALLNNAGQCVGGIDPINSERSDQTCIQNVIIDGERYDVLIFCENNDGTSVGVRVDNNGNRESQTITFGGFPLDEWANRVVGAVTGENVEWFTRNSVFGAGRFEITNVDGKPGIRLIFGNPSGDPNRALRGFYLLNMLYGEIAGCQDNCRVFPPRFQAGQVLLGVSDLAPMGDAIYMDYDIHVHRDKWPASLNELPQTFQVTACYYYTTTLTPTVCVDPDPSDNRGDPCVAGPLVYRNTQGSPIAVTRIDQRSVPGGTLFTIHLKHVGNGRFWEPGSLPLCGPYSSARRDPRREDVVHLLDARMSGDIQRLDCSPKNENGYGTTSVRFQNGVGQVNCIYRQGPLAMQTRQAYQTALTLEFGYLYQNIISKRTIIHRT